MQQGEKKTHETLITHVVYARGGKGGLWNNSSDPTTFRDLFQVEEEEKHLNHATIECERDCKLSLP